MANWLWIAGVLKCYWAFLWVCNRIAESWSFDTYRLRSWNDLSWLWVLDPGPFSSGPCLSSTSNTITKTYSNLLQYNIGVGGRSWWIYRDHYLSCILLYMFFIIFYKFSCFFLLGNLIMLPLLKNPCATFSVADLKQTDCQSLLQQKDGFIQISREMQLGVYNLWWSPNSKERRMLL